MSNQSQIQSYRIGYALAPKKEQTFIQPSLISKATERGIDLIRIDSNKPLIDQGPFDCIIHKLYGPDWTQQLQQFSSHHTDVSVIDSPELIERLHNRLSMLEAVSNLNEVRVPNQIVISETEILRSENAIAEMKMRFPVIAKPLVVDGTAKSHQMYLIFDNKGLEVLEAPIILQEFVNHGGVMFKVYVAGSSVKCVKRRSLPDISDEKIKSLKGFKPFSQISNTVEVVDMERVEMPSENFVVELAGKLREALGLNLINFDLIRDDDDKYLVIDINYLPGYTKVPGYESFLMDFFLSLANNKTEQGITTE